MTLIFLASTKLHYRNFLRCRDVVAVSRDSYVRCVEGLVHGGMRRSERERGGVSMAAKG